MKENKESSKFWNFLNKIKNKFVLISTLVEFGVISSISNTERLPEKVNVESNMNQDEKKDQQDDNTPDKKEEFKSILEETTMENISNQEDVESMLEKIYAEYWNNTHEEQVDASDVDILWKVDTNFIYHCLAENSKEIYVTHGDNQEQTVQWIEDVNATILGEESNASIMQVTINGNPVDGIYKGKYVVSGKYFYPTYSHMNSSILAEHLELFIVNGQKAYNNPNKFNIRELYATYINECQTYNPEKENNEQNTDITK